MRLFPEGLLCQVRTEPLPDAGTVLLCCQITAKPLPADALSKTNKDLLESITVDHPRRFPLIRTRPIAEDEAGIGLPRARSYAFTSVPAASPILAHSGSGTSERRPGDYEVTSVVHNDTYPAIDPGSHDLTGSAVFITGASRGIGRATALSFARAGASYIGIAARSDLADVAAEIQAIARSASRSVTVLPIKLDVSDESDVMEASRQVQAAFGRLHVLVNNAGVLGKYGLIADSDPTEWLRVIDVNLRGPYLVTRAFLPLLLATAGNRFVVNVSSAAAFLTNPTLSAYQVSKAALLKLSTLTNVEYSARGITTFTVHPGNVPTDIMGGPDAVPPHHKHVFIETTELGADSIVYLTSRDRAWLGGRYINCTWDLPELLSKEKEIVAGDKLKSKLDF